MSHGAHSHATLLAPANVLPRGTGKGVGLFLMALGLGAIAYLANYFRTGDATAQTHAMFAYHLGFVFALCLTLGALAFVMALHQTGAGWSAVVRRQFENIMSAAPLMLLLFIPTAILCVTKPGLLFHWMDAHAASDPLFVKKQAFLNTPFFLARAAIYFTVWIGLVALLRGNSLRQDQDGDRWRTRTMRRLSAPGLALFALATAFAAFDWLMSVDYHFFSTMWGVYYFAQSMLAALALGVLMLLLLRNTGKLEGVVTKEHFHDLGKLIFGFTVFWGYIAFSQYFLIWYANIPEETAFFIARREGGWMDVSRALAIGKFILPFLVMLPRPSRRSPVVLALVCVWILSITVLEQFWVIGPAGRKAFGGAPEVNWVDALGLAGPLLMFLGFVAWRAASTPLIPLKDPRLDLSLHHKNYI